MTNHETREDEHPTRNLLDSKVNQLDDALTERLQQALHAHSFDVHVHEVAKIACEYSAIDLGFAVSRLPPDARIIVYENLPHWDAKVDFFINTDSNTRATIYRQLTDKEISDLISRMPADEAVWVLEDLPDRRIRRLMDTLDQKRAAEIQEIARHGRHSAGRLMTNEFFAFTMDVTLGEAAKYIREHPGIDLTTRVFVLDASGCLQGHVPARNFIVNPPDLPLRQVMQPIHHQVNPETSRDEVVSIAERYKIPALPVVDDQEHLVGVIPYEEVVECIEDMADETLAQVAGTLEDVTAHESIFKRFFARAPWLLVTLCGGLINAMNMAYFEQIMSSWMAFAIFFVPLVTGMSGNVGVQCSTVLVRSMAIGILSVGSRARAVRKEISIGLLTGLIFGVGCGLLVYALNALGIQHLHANPLAIGVVISSGLFGACFTATLLGVFSPLFFARIGVDPAISSGPIVTAFNDVLSMIMYFLIAQGISTLLPLV